MCIRDRTKVYLGVDPNLVGEHLRHLSNRHGGLLGALKYLERTQFHGLAYLAGPWVQGRKAIEDTEAGAEVVSKLLAGRPCGQGLKRKVVEVSLRDFAACSYLAGADQVTGGWARGGTVAREEEVVG